MRPTGLDRWLHGLRPGLVRTLAWVVVNLLVLIATSAVALAVGALPPLSLLPTDVPLSPSDHALLTVVFPLLTWPVHLAVVAAVSRARRARLWSALTAPLTVPLIVFLLPLLLVLHDATARSVVLAYVLYGLLCRLHPRRWDARPGPVVSAG